MSDEEINDTPELRIRQLEEDLTKEKDRLEKLYAGYTASKMPPMKRMQQSMF